MSSETPERKVPPLAALDEEELIAFLQKNRHHILGPLKDDPKTWVA